MSAARFESFVRENLANGPWQYADGEPMGADAADFCDQMDALRAELDTLKAQWAAVPWEQLWRLYNGVANDETFQTVFTWLLANTPDDAAND